MSEHISEYMKGISKGIHLKSVNEQDKDHWDNSVWDGAGPPRSPFKNEELIFPAAGSPHPSQTPSVHRKSHLEKLIYQATWNEWCK